MAEHCKQSAGITVETFVILHENSSQSNVVYPCLYAGLRSFPGNNSKASYCLENTQSISLVTQHLSADANVYKFQHPHLNSSWFISLNFQLRCLTTKDTWQIIRPYRLHLATVTNMSLDTRFRPRKCFDNPSVFIHPNN